MLKQTVTFNFVNGRIFLSKLFGWCWPRRMPTWNTPLSVKIQPNESHFFLDKTVRMCRPPEVTFFIICQISQTDSGWKPWTLSLRLQGSGQQMCVFLWGSGQHSAFVWRGRGFNPQQSPTGTFHSGHNRLLHAEEARRTKHSLKLTSPTFSNNFSHCLPCTRGEKAISACLIWPPTTTKNERPLTLPKGNA